MNPRHTRPIRSAAIGHKTESLKYDAEAGYLIIELDNRMQLWLSADSESFHIFMLAPHRTVRHTTSQPKTTN